MKLLLIALAACGGTHEPDPTCTPAATNYAKLTSEAARGANAAKLGSAATAPDTSEMIAPLVALCAKWSPATRECITHATEITATVCGMTEDQLVDLAQLQGDVMAKILAKGSAQ